MKFSTPASSELHSVIHNSQLAINDHIVSILTEAYMPGRLTCESCKKVCSQPIVYMYYSSHYLLFICVDVWR